MLISNSLSVPYSKLKNGAETKMGQANAKIEFERKFKVFFSSQRGFIVTKARVNERSMRAAKSSNSHSCLTPALSYPHQLSPIMNMFKILIRADERFIYLFAE